MKFIFDNIPIAIVIVGICMLMLYPYIGAGLLLAALCFEAEQYVLMVIAFLICMLLQSTMGRRIKPYHVPVKPSRASRRRQKKKKAPGRSAQASAGSAAQTSTGSSSQVSAVSTAANNSVDGGGTELNADADSNNEYMIEEVRNGS